MVNRIFKVGVIGHREIGGEEQYSFVHLCCHKLLVGLKAKYPDVTAISAISEGADSIFAKSAIALDISLESVIPHDDFSSDFINEINYETYRSIRNKSKYETTVNFTKRNCLAYKKSMEWLVFKSNVIIAIWDGNEVGTVGGTWESILLCKKLRKPIIHINCLTNELSTYVEKNNKYRLHVNLTAQNAIRYV